MKEKEKRIASMQKELMGMYETLFGATYIPGLQDGQKEFNLIIEKFNEKMFAIRQDQDERSKRQAKKNYLQSPEAIRLNQTIREDIKAAESLLAEAVKCLEIDSKKGGKASDKLREDRTKLIKNLYEVLKDAREREEGGVYQPPTTHVSLQQIKKNLIRREQEKDQEINLEEEEAMDRLHAKDKELDDMLNEVIGVNAEVRKQLQYGNEIIDQQGDMIRKNTKKVDLVDQMVVKADNDLAEVLKSYRRPSKLCLDITLIFMVLALIGVIINMVKNS